jgi:NADH-quinone oxidoreductase subunit N
MRQSGRMVEEISDLSGLSKSHPMMALSLAVFMWSMAGVPPAAGFWGKLYVFKAAVDADLTILALIGLLTSAISLYYYLRIIKVIYFDEQAEPLDRPSRSVALVIGGTALFTFPVFYLFANPLFNGAVAAATSLFP